MWSEGVIGIPDAKDKEKYTKCHYWVKHYDEPSETYGINGGRISKLMIKIDGETVCNYDRGWDIHPTCKEAEMALCILLIAMAVFYFALKGGGHRANAKTEKL